ncbi:MAG: 16S rRNA (uracil(1498)-N(3))-methyltransferase [Clostridia bacterium]|nr:16S rRNA (uracil(1498)-N(3))-methyltransferase [Clostridia bacterium]
MSGRKRFFIEKLNGNETEVFLEGEEFIHAKTVLRVEEGAEIILLDGSGKEYFAIVAKIEKHRLLAHITGAIVGEREPETPIYLLCGALKGDKTELIVQKATELGVSKIGVFSSEYCSAFMNGNKIDRLKKVAKEAAKQCLRSRVPEIEYFGDFESAMKSASGYKNKLFACEFLESNCGGDFSRLSGSTAVVVGSEGGFSHREYELSQTLGFTGISLGKRILRAETAAIAVCTLAAFALGELK